MLGHTRVRLGVTYPEITRMQAAAILEATAELLAEKVDARPEIMIPLVGHVAELQDQKRVACSRRRRWCGRNTGVKKLPSRSGR